MAKFNAAADLANHLKMTEFVKIKLKRLKSNDLHKPCLDTSKHSNKLDNLPLGNTPVNNAHTEEALRQMEEVVTLQILLICHCTCRKARISQSSTFSRFQRKVIFNLRF